MNTTGAIALGAPTSVEHTEDGVVVTGDLPAELVAQVEEQFLAQTITGKGAGQPEGIVVQLDRDELARQIDVFVGRSAEGSNADKIDYDISAGPEAGRAELEQHRYVPPPASIRLPDEPDRPYVVPNRRDRRRAQRDARRRRR